MRLLNKLSLESRLSWLVGLGVSLLALAVYVLTLSPTVNFIDSGELIAVGVQAGIAHPPGYPLYSLLAVIGARLPFGDPAVGVNLVSAVAGALAVGLFYALVYEIVRHHLQFEDPGALWATGTGDRGRKQTLVPDPRSGRAPQLQSPKSKVQQTGGRGPRSLVSPASGVRERSESRGSVLLAAPTPGPRPPHPQAGTRVAQRAPGSPIPDPWYAISSSAGAALLLCASFTFWSWSTQAKMYSLHFAFVAGLFTLALRARRAVEGAGEPGPLWPPRLRLPRPWPTPARRLIVLAFGLGLALTNHTLSFLLVPSLAIILLWPQRLASLEVTRPARQRDNRRDAPLWSWLLAYLPWLVLAGLIPLLLYLYLPLRSAQQPPLNWGSPSTLGDFWRHVSLTQYSVLIGQQVPGGLPSYIGRTTELAVRQLGPWLSVPTLLLAVVGVVRLARARSALPLLVAMTLLVLITLAQTYNFQNPEVAAYSEHMYMMFIAWAGVGLYSIGDRGPQQTPKPIPVAQRAPGSPIPALVPLGLAALALVWNAGRAGHANDYMADAFIHNHFNNYKPQAVVITNNWFFVSPSYYLQYVRRERPDVAVIDRKLLDKPFYFNYVTRQYPDVMATVKDLAGPFGEITRRWWDGEQVDSQQISRLYFDMMHALITRNLDAGRPVYLQWHDPGPEEAFIAQGLSTHPEGLALRVDAQPFAGPPPDPQFDWRGILTDVVPKDEIARVVIADYPVALDQLAAYSRQTNHPAEATRFAAEAGQVRAAIGPQAPP